MAPCTHPGMKRPFCLKAKNRLGRFAPSALPHYYTQVQLDFTKSLVGQQAEERDAHGTWRYYWAPRCQEMPSHANHSHSVSGINISMYQVQGMYHSWRSGLYKRELTSSALISYHGISIFLPVIVCRPPKRHVQL